jgi:hypothetical protein
MGRQVDMYDENIVYFTERVKPGIDNLSSHRNQSFRECGSRRLCALKPEASPAGLAPAPKQNLLFNFLKIGVPV